MATTERAPAGKTRFEGAAPILGVRDIGQSLRYYEAALGFTRAAWVREDSTFAFISRDRAGIYLCQGGQGLRVLVADPRPLAASLARQV